MTLLDQILQITQEFPPHTHREIIAALLKETFGI